MFKIVCLAETSFNVIFPQPQPQRFDHSYYASERRNELCSDLRKLSRLKEDLKPNPFEVKHIWDGILEDLEQQEAPFPLDRFKCSYDKQTYDVIGSNGTFLTLKKGEFQLKIALEDVSSISCVTRETDLQKIKIEETDKRLGSTDKRLGSFDKDFFIYSDTVPPEIYLNTWKFGIDARDHQYGPDSYDNGTNTCKVAEPGYKDAMTTGIGYILRTLGEGITVEFVRKVHRLCTTNVRAKVGIISLVRSPSTFSPGRCPLCPTFLTKDGLLEMLTYSFVELGIFSNYNPDQKENRLSKHNLHRALEDSFYGESIVSSTLCVPTTIEGFIESLYLDLELASDSYSKIESIACFLKKLDVLHPFLDGNIRTIRLLLLKLLIENGLEPSYVWNPNIIDGHSSKEIAAEIIKGQALWRETHHIS